MGIKSFRPTTPTRRYQTVVDYSELSKVKPTKSLLEPKRSKAGRNNLGRITTRHRGQGVKRAYRLVDFKRDKVGIPAKVASIEYDPNRTAFIALLNYADGEKRYILAPLGLKVGFEVIASENADIRPGNALPLKAIPVGTLIHNIELRPKKGGQMARSAGSYARILGREGSYVQLRMPSGEIRKVHASCWATVGQVGNTDHENIKIGKAGRKRKMGFRPTVRGVVMNPVDHPMGGGEGRASGGIPRAPWGWCTKGLKTRNNKRTNTFIIKRKNSK